MPSNARADAAQFLNQLKHSKNEFARIQSARSLLKYVNGELKENSSNFVEEFLKEFEDERSGIADLVSSSDPSEKKGGIFAIVCLVGVDTNVTDNKRVTKFSSYLLNKTLQCNDLSVVELSAKAIAHVAVSSNVYANQLVERSLNLANEWLTDVERKEERRYAAVLLNRELARSTPTFFFQNATKFFDNIFKVVRDPKPELRVEAVAALRAALVVTSQRETQQKQKTQWYTLCYEEAKHCFTDARTEDKINRIHSGLLTCNELLRIANTDGEKSRQDALELVKQDNKMHRFGTVEFSSQVRHRKGLTHTGGTDDVISRLAAPPYPSFFESKTCRNLVSEHYDEICNFVVEARNVKSPFVQQVLLELLPRLAAFNSEKFITKYLNDSLNYVLLHLGKEKDKRDAFLALGLLSNVAKEKLKSHIGKIFEVVRWCLHSKDKKKWVQVDPTLFTCLTLLVSALKENLTEQIKQILESMFATGLSPGLTVCLREIAREIPALRTDIQDGLLDQLSMIIMERKMPNKLQPPPPFELPPAPVVVSNVPAVVLGLRTLGSFQFPRHSLEMFLKYISHAYLNSSEREIRLATVKCCCQLLVPFVLLLDKVKKKQRNLPLLKMIHEVINKLVAVGITDPDTDVRLCVFECLSEPDSPFSVHLAQAEMLQLIFMGLQDESYEIRETVLALLGRLGDINPAYVMPTLRTVVIQILSELNNSGMNRIEEQSARLLSQLVSSAPKFMKPYMQSVLQTLIPKLQKETKQLDVVLALLNAIGELSQVGGVELMESLEQLMPILIEFLQDTALAKREAALWAMGQLIQHTGYVIEPYRHYPELMDILLRFLKTEQSISIRRETIKVLGILGALDPYQHKVFTGSVESAANSTSLALSMPDARDTNDPRQEIVQWFNWERFTLEEFYPALAIANLMHILSDQGLTEKHKDVIEAVLRIFTNLGSKCIPYVDQVVPRFIPVIRQCQLQLREFFFQQLGTLISIVKQHIKPYMKDILQLIKEFWTPETPMRQTIITVVEQIATALEYEFKPFVPELLPAILRVFTNDYDPGKTVTAKLLDALQKCSFTLEEHLHMIIPPVVKLFQDDDNVLRLSAVKTLLTFSETMSLAQFAPRILHAILALLSQSKSSEIHFYGIRLIVALSRQMGKNFLIFRPQVDFVLHQHRVLDSDYHLEFITSQFDAYGRLVEPERKRKFDQYQTRLPEVQDRKHALQFNQLEKAWTVNLIGSKDDWAQWLRELRVTLLKQSPYSSLRACGNLSVVQEQLARDLFNAAFMSVWTELEEERQDKLTASLQEALEHSEHPEIIQTILNLAEFMDHSEKGPLPIEPKVLGNRAMKTRAYAKALRYTELELLGGTITANNLEALITLNNQLQLQEEAVGVVEFAKRQNISFQVQGRWFEKLHQWDKALECYDMQDIQTDEKALENACNRMRCLEALGDWNKLHATSKEFWNYPSRKEFPEFPSLAAAGAWGFGDWTQMEEYVSAIDKNTQEGAFLRAVLQVHKKEYQVARQYIDKFRDMIDTELTAMAGESYERAYGCMVSVQKVSELEEAIQYKLIPERRSDIAKIWKIRLQGCRDSVEDWQKLLQVRSLVLTYNDMRDTWMKFASLCRRSGKVGMSRKILLMLLNGDPSKSTKDFVFPPDKPELIFAYAKQLWTEEQHESAYELLKNLTENMMPKVSSSHSERSQDPELTRLTARCYLKLGHWTEMRCQKFGEVILKMPQQKNGSGSGTQTQSGTSQAMMYFIDATCYDSSWYKAWHALAACYFNAVLDYKKPVESSHFPAQTTAPVSPGGLGNERKHEKIILHQYARKSVKCFFRAINLCRGSRLQDTLRLLTLWFEYGQNADVYDALREGLQQVPVETWLQVIPQLIARIDTCRQLVLCLIMQELTEIGKAHPQALVYPLTVAVKSTNKGRVAAASKLLTEMSQHSPVLVQQARLVSEELIRVAILWHELWHEGLEEASRQYFADHNVQGMFSTLEPLHKMIEEGPSTLKEQSFNQTYYRDLKEAKDWCDKYKRTGNVKDLSQAWDLYYVVFKRISKQLPQLTSLELQYVSPKLLMCRDLELAVPGTYDSKGQLVRIHSLHQNIQVITSKQRPRKVCLKGSDGNDYWFLLKGHEDPRQDERVMQLFGLVNTLLLQEPDTCRRNLTIQRYSIIPLSQNSGLIGWVPNCDTLHALLRDFREKKKILLNIEHKLMQRMAPDYDHLTLMQKVEVFEHALDYTEGDDLQRILWLKSPSSEVWFDRRTNYTRSLATMSMVGYILGLGDRHPSNLMLDRMSGKIVHIDFGDCFEVAMTREKFPEKIPFRLTRMLVNAMEVTGIEGNFKVTCERVMKVMRENRESLLAVLEAFVYDPLINWRLVDQGVGPKKTHPEDIVTSSVLSSAKDGDESETVPEDLGFGGVAQHVEADQALPTEAVSAKAVQVIQRIRDKLSGRDFGDPGDFRAAPSDVGTQVNNLIEQAVSHENLCQCYIGWCPFW